MRLVRPLRRLRSPWLVRPLRLVRLVRPLRQVQPLRLVRLMRLSQTGLDRGIDGRTESLDHCFQLGLAGNEGRRQQDVVATLAVDRAAHRVDHQTTRHGLLLDSRVQLARRVEGRLAAALVHQLDAAKQTAAAQLAHMRVSAERGLQRAGQELTVVAHFVHQAIARYHFLHGQRRGAGHRMAQVGVAMLEEAAALAHASTMRRCASTAPMG